MCPDTPTQEARTVKEEEDIVVIVPKISEFSSAGEMKIDFDPPRALVPKKWDFLFDSEQHQDLSPEKKAAVQTLSNDAFQVSFIKNSDEENQSEFSAKLEQFESGGLSIQVQFSEPLLVSQGEDKDQVVVRLKKSYFTQVEGQEGFNVDDGRQRRRLLKGRELVVEDDVDDDDDDYHQFTYEVPK